MKTEPLRTAYSYEEMVEKAKLYMLENFGTCKGSTNKEQWYEHLGLLISFILDNFPKNT